MVEKLSELTGLELHESDNLFESMQSMADAADFSASLRTLALTLVRIANDFRLLSSGPSTGLDEIRLPAVQPGSSIMPGKVNPVMAEMLDQAMFHVIGCDTTVALGAQAGQLELNVMMPVIAHNSVRDDAGHDWRGDGVHRASSEGCGCQPGKGRRLAGEECHRGNGVEPVDRLFPGRGAGQGSDGAECGHQRCGAGKSRKRNAQAP
jgi:hypothetical protein